MVITVTVVTVLLVFMTYKLNDLFGCKYKQYKT
jgi:hypothetical protein